MSVNSTEVVVPTGPLNPESVSELFGTRFLAIDCGSWVPVYHEGARKLVQLVKHRKEKIILFNMTPMLALQLGLLGVPVYDGRTVIDPASNPGE